MSQTDEKDMEPSQADVINWKGLFTTLTGLGVVACVGFIVTAWNVTDDVSRVADQVDDLATKEEMEKADKDTLDQAKQHTERRMGDLLRKTDANSQKLQTISDDLREMKREARIEGTEVQNTLREISTEMKRIQIEQARRSPTP